MASAMPHGVPAQYPGLQPLRPSAAKAGWNAVSPNGTAEACPDALAANLLIAPCIEDVLPRLNRPLIVLV